jgi:hypothetical protein
MSLENPLASRGGGFGETIPYWSWVWGFDSSGLKWKKKKCKIQFLKRNLIDEKKTVELN